jgi:malonyl-CoA/methylmalonyl-CoA synthetase
MMLLSSQKFKDKAEDVIAEGITHKPIIAVEKIMEGNKSAESINFEDIGVDQGGLMLYTSGTTNRPVG